MGDLDEDAGPVAGVLLGAHRPAVLEVAEHLERLLHDVVRGPSLQVDHEAEAAGVLLVLGIVEALPGGVAGLAHLVPVTLKWTGECGPPRE